MLQKLWQLGLEWDEAIPSIPTSLHTEFVQFREQIPRFHSLECPDYLFLKILLISLQCHGFCDTSQTAYGCCLFLRAMDSFGNVSSRLICAKSRVAPLKIISLPRLELCGALFVASRTYVKNTKCTKYSY